MVTYKTEFNGDGPEPQDAFAKKYKNVSTAQVQREYDAHLASSPGEYDVTGPWNSRQNLKYREWFKMKIALEELLSSRKIEKGRTHGGENLPDRD